MKIAVIEYADDSAVTPRSYRTNTDCLRLVARELADWVSKTVVRLREGITLSGIGQMLSTFIREQEVWYPTFEVKFDPKLRESPGLRYPLLLARRQQSFAYSGAAYA
jgi:hypothetical protein